MKEKISPYAGQRLRKLRQTTEIRQTELASQLGVTPNYISMVECGRKTPSELMLRKAAAVFNVSVDWLLSHNHEQQDLNLGVELLDPPQEFSCSEDDLDISQFLCLIAQSSSDHLRSFCTAAGTTESQLLETMFANSDDTTHKIDTDAVTSYIDNSLLSREHLSETCQQLLKLKKSTDYLVERAVSSLIKEVQTLLVSTKLPGGIFCCKEYPRARNRAPGHVTDFFALQQEGADPVRYVYLNEAVMELRSSDLPCDNNWVQKVIQATANTRYPEKEVILLATDRTTWRQIDQAAQSLPSEFTERFSRISIQYLDLNHEDHGIFWQVYPVL